MENARLHTQELRKIGGSSDQRFQPTISKAPRPPEKRSLLCMCEVSPTQGIAEPGRRGTLRFMGGDIVWPQPTRETPLLLRNTLDDADAEGGRAPRPGGAVWEIVSERSRGTGERGWGE